MELLCIGPSRESGTKAPPLAWVSQGRWTQLVSFSLNLNISPQPRAPHNKRRVQYLTSLSPLLLQLGKGSK